MSSSSVTIHSLKTISANYRRVLAGWLYVLAALTLLGLSPVVSAEGTATIAQGFKTNLSTNEAVSGAMVSTKAGSTDTVELTSSDNVSRLIGVVDTKPLLTISNGSSQAQVVLSGATQVLVSDINGAVKAGDRITASPLAGVGMRATVDSQIIGSAQTDQVIDVKDAKTIKDKKGKDRQVHISTVPLQVGVAFYQMPGGDGLPSFVQNFANSIAGKQVSLIRAFLSGFVLLAAVVIIIILINTSARASVASIGRNPLAALAIRRGLYQVIGLAAVILVFGLLASYLLLKV